MEVLAIKVVYDIRTDKGSPEASTASLPCSYVRVRIIYVHSDAPDTAILGVQHVLAIGKRTQIGKT